MFLLRVTGTKHAPSVAPPRSVGAGLPCSRPGVREPWAPLRTCSLTLLGRGFSGSAQPCGRASPAANSGSSAPACVYRVSVAALLKEVLAEMGIIVSFRLFSFRAGVGRLTKKKGD